MKKKLLFFLLCSFSITLLSCNKQSTDTENNQKTSSNTITIDSPQKQGPAGVTLGNVVTYPNIFQATPDKNIFIDWRSNNKLSVFPKAVNKDMFPNLENETTYDLSSSSTSIALYNNGIIYGDSSDSGSIHMATNAPKESTKLLSDVGDNFIVIDNNLYYINESSNNILIKYNLDTRSKSALTQDSVGKYIIIGDWVIYQNISDSYKIYGVKLDGASRTKLSNSSAESFGLYKGNIVFVNSSDNDNLYLLSINNLAEKKIFDVKAQAVVSINDTIFFINKDDINTIYTLSETGDSKFSDSKLSSDSIISYYPFENSIFYIRSLSPESGIYRIENSYK